MHLRWRREDLRRGDPRRGDRDRPGIRRRLALAWRGGGWLFLRCASASRVESGLCEMDRAAAEGRGTDTATSRSALSSASCVVEAPIVVRLVNFRKRRTKGK
jgi:hypothetical protein